MGKKENKFWVTMACLVVGILAGLGIIPGSWGLVSNVVLDNLDKVEVTESEFDGCLANVIRVIDGDTIEVELVTSPEHQETLRLIGVDTPETVHPQMPVQFFGPEATQYTKNMCLGKTVKLHLQKNGPERGNYGRLLVYVELSPEVILNESIIKDGFGYSYTKCPHEHLGRYNTLQVDAINARRGLWATVKFNDLPAWLRKSDPDILK